jgi:hypothetical protein
MHSDIMHTIKLIKNAMQAVKEKAYLTLLSVSPCRGMLDKKGGKVKYEKKPKTEQRELDEVQIANLG